jgi:hypothetical protein
MTYSPGELPTSQRVNTEHSRRLRCDNALAGRMAALEVSATAHQFANHIVEAVQPNSLIDGRYGGCGEAVIREGG